MFFLFVAGAVLGATIAAAEAPPSVASLLSEAQARAAQGQRAIFTIFHASW
jgi:hypothetical protein